MELWNLRTNEKLAAPLQVATTFWRRLVGLLGRPLLPTGEALWIHSCNSIHTWFMQFSIDVVFVDRNLKVVAVRTEVPPWRIVWGGFAARSVFEFAAGQITHCPVQIGDQLDVKD